MIGPQSANPITDPTQVDTGPFVDSLNAEVMGRARHWTLVAPGTTGDAVDLVIVLHGVGHLGAEMRSLGFDDLARSAGVAVAYPDGADGMWNDGRPGADPPASGAGWTDDIAFLRAVVAQSAQRMNRGVRSVGVVGFSNGAIMAARVACDMADIVTVVAIVDGSAGEGFESRCLPDRPVSVALVATRGDPVVPYAGGQVASWQGRARGRVAGADATVRFWSAADHCSPLRDTGVAASSPMVVRAQADGCASTRQVVRLAVDDPTHEWIRTGGFDTTAVVWSFVHAELARSFDLDLAGMS